MVDRGSILLVVYVAFSEGVTQGIWHQVDIATLGTLLAVDASLLAAVLCLTTVTSRVWGSRVRTRSRWCSAAPRKASRAGCRWPPCLLAGQSAGLIVLPLMLFHQIQLMACAALARRYASCLNARAPAGVALAK